MSTPSRIAELASIISANTSKINDYLQTHNLPQPSFEINGPVQPVPSTAPELEEARLQAVEATIELQQLLQGVDKLLLPEVSILFPKTPLIRKLILSPDEYDLFTRNFTFQDSLALPDWRRNLLLFLSRESQSSRA